LTTKLTVHYVNAPAFSIILTFFAADLQIACHAKAPLLSAAKILRLSLARHGKREILCSAQDDT